MGPPSLRRRASYPSPLLRGLSFRRKAFPRAPGASTQKPSERKRFISCNANDFTSSAITSCVWQRLGSPPARSTLKWHVHTAPHVGSASRPSWSSPPLSHLARSSGTKRRLTSFSRPRPKPTRQLSRRHSDRRHPRRRLQASRRERQG